MAKIRMPVQAGTWLGVMLRADRAARPVASLSVILCLAGCGSFISESGPGRQAVLQQGDVLPTRPAAPAPYLLVPVNADTVADLAVPPPQPRFAFAPDPSAPRGAIGVGDDIGITIFEAAPGGLFITDHPENPSGNSVTLPAQQVDGSGAVTVPYGGKVAVLGQTPAAVGQAIQRRLSARALEPQVVVTILNRRSGVINVVGDVAGAARFSLDSGGDTLLGAIARAGGPRYPDYETIVALQRQGAVQKARLSDIAEDPSQNVALEPGDTVYVAHRPDFFLAMGATGQTTSLGPLDRRIAFGGATITLADALARAGGLEDDRANARALFVYRFERKRAGPPGVVPTIYLADLRDPKGYFYAGRFMMHPEDVIFVSNAPATDLAKFLALVLPAAYASSGFNSGFR